MRVVSWVTWVYNRMRLRLVFAHSTLSILVLFPTGHRRMQASQFFRFTFVGHLAAGRRGRDTAEH